MARESEKFKREWARVSKIVAAYNRSYGTGYTMRYAFGAPSVDRLATMSAIHSQSDLGDYLIQNRISPPPPPKAEVIEFNNLLSRFSALPEGFEQNILQYLMKLHETVDQRVLMDAIKSIIFVLDTSYHYDVSNYGRHYIDTIKEISASLQEAAPDKAEDIKGIEQEALSKAEQLIDEENFPIV